MKTEYGTCLEHTCAIADDHEHLIEKPALSYKGECLIQRALNFMIWFEANH